MKFCCFFQPYESIQSASQCVPETEWVGTYLFHFNKTGHRLKYPNDYIFLSMIEDFYFNITVQTLMKCQMTFILVFTVC